ncbi:mannosyltransferase putative-domain-containing protein [Zopfochytrium polystomum]|nr:mannosyltransferase putative-domain-containing protein [Zopfochytrium polystomum]
MMRPFRRSHHSPTGTESNTPTTKTSTRWTRRKRIFQAKGKRVHHYEGVFYDWIGNKHGLEHCVRLPPRQDMNLLTYNFSAQNPDVGALYHKVHKEAYSDNWKSLALKKPNANEPSVKDDDKSTAGKKDAGPIESSKKDNQKGDRKGDKMGDSKPNDGKDIHEVHKEMWKRFVAETKPYDPKFLGITPGSRGVVITGPGNRIKYAVLTANLLRQTGCTLPIQFSYLKGQVSNEDLKLIQEHNITAVDFTPAVSAYNWGEREVSLGGPKVDAILASPFEQVLFLDPDVQVLENPEYLFETATFKKNGALFWPDTYRRGHWNRMWDLFDLQDKMFQQMEFESGQMLIDKSKTWKGLMLAKHLAAEAKYYFDHFWGDKEAFFWGFRATNTPYFLNPNYLSIVGVLADKKHPRGGIELPASASSTPANTRFCGLSMLQMSFHDDTTGDASAKPPRGYKPKPLFLHGNGVKYAYHDEVAPYHVAKTYIPKDEGKNVHDYEGIGHEWIGALEELQHCVDFVEKKGVELKVWVPLLSTIHRLARGKSRRERGVP